MSFDDEPEVQTPPPSLVGKTIRGKFKILRQIGEGGMGAVYEAENTWTQRKVAIKVLHSFGYSAQQNARRFMQEARAAANIRHPNIVDVLDIDTDTDGTLFLVQELLDGETLRERLKRDKTLEVKVALNIVVPVMGALFAAHQRGIIHRDIKPDNIFLAQLPGDIKPKLIDFGVAKVPRREGNTLTDSGHLVGTPVYMSPEQASGDRDIDARSDLWAIATVLYELLTGTPPLIAPSAPRVLVRVLTEKPERLGVHCPELPADFCAVIDRALTPLETRWPDMRAFVDAIIQSSLFDTDRESFLAKHREAIDPALYAPMDQPRMTEPDMPPATKPITSDDSPTMGELPRLKANQGDKPVGTADTWEGPSQDRLASTTARPSPSLARYVFIGSVALGLVAVAAFSLGKYDRAGPPGTSSALAVGTNSHASTSPDHARVSTLTPIETTATHTTDASAANAGPSTIGGIADSDGGSAAHTSRVIHVNRASARDASAREATDPSNNAGFFTNYPR